MPAKNEYRHINNEFGSSNMRIQCPQHTGASNNLIKCLQKVNMMHKPKQKFFHFAIAMALIASALFLAGCIKQSNPANCNSITDPSQTFNKAICYQQMGVYESIYGDSASAVAKCDLILSDAITKEYTEVYRSCITESASNLKEPAICSNIRTKANASFISMIANLDTTEGMVKACEATAKPPASTVCNTTVLAMLSTLALVGFVSSRKKNSR